MIWLLLFLPIFSLTWIDGYLINGYREREFEILLIMMKTNEIEKVSVRKREIERERERERQREMCKGMKENRITEKRVKQMKRSHTVYDKCLQVCTWWPNYWATSGICEEMSAYYSTCFDDGSQRKHVKRNAC